MSLRHQLNGCNIAVEIALQHNVEILVLGAGAVIGEVQRLVDQRIYVDGLSIAAAAARMRQHALDDAVSAPPMLGDFFQIAGQHPDDLVDLFTHIIAERSHGGRRCLLQLVQ